MKRVWSSELLAEVSHLNNLLEQHGIASFVRNQQLCGALGEIPFLECLPELWVVDDRDWDAALELIEALNEPVAAPPWDCTGCGRPNDGQFALCWNCGAPDEAAPNEPA